MILEVIPKTGVKYNKNRLLREVKDTLKEINENLLFQRTYTDFSVNKVVVMGEKILINFNAVSEFKEVCNSFGLLNTNPKLNFTELLDSEKHLGYIRPKLTASKVLNGIVYNLNLLAFRLSELGYMVTPVTLKTIKEIINFKSKGSLLDTNQVHELRKSLAVMMCNMNNSKEHLDSIKDDNIMIELINTLVNSDLAKEITVNIIDNSEKAIPRVGLGEIGFMLVSYFQDYLNGEVCIGYPEIRHYRTKEDFIDCNKPHHGDIVMISNKNIPWGYKVLLNKDNTQNIDKWFFVYYIEALNGLQKIDKRVIVFEDNFVKKEVDKKVELFKCIRDVHKSFISSELYIALEAYPKTVKQVLEYQELNTFRRTELNRFIDKSINNVDFLSKEEVEYVESLIGWSKDLKSKYYRELLDNYINTKPEYQKYKGILQEYSKETMTKKEKEDLF